MVKIFSSFIVLLLSNIPWQVVRCLSIIKHFTIRNINVASGIPNNCDVLIGIDIISRGDFAVSNAKEKTSFSFGMPSICEIDFCKHSYLIPESRTNIIGRNSSCPCGGGEKYKKCCKWIIRIVLWHSFTNSVTLQGVI